MARSRSSRRSARSALAPEFAVVRRLAIAAAATLLGLWVAWFALTYSVRSELRRVERSLEEHSKLQDVNLSIPWLSRTMPTRVPLKGVWIPGGFSYEVQIEIKGEYLPAERVARVQGRKQILMPYRRVAVDETVAVPPP